MTFTGMCTFSSSSTIVGSHLENWEEFDVPDAEIYKPDEPLEYFSDSIGQQQAQLIGNVGVSPVSLSPQNFPK